MTSRLQALGAGLAAVGAALGLCALLALAPAAALAADAEAASAVPAAASAAVSSTVAASVAPDPAATLMVLNRPIARFHVTLPGLPPAERATRANEEVTQTLQSGGPGKVGFITIPIGTMVTLDGIGVFPLMPGDLTGGQTIGNVVRALQQAVDEGREARSVGVLLRAVGFALVATLVFAAGVWVLRRLRAWFSNVLVSLGQRHSGRLIPGGVALLTRDRIVALTRVVTTLLHYAVLLILTAEWLGVMLRLFPYTRRWGEELHDSGFALAVQILGAVASSLPGLAVAVVIYVIARAVLGLADPLFKQVETGELSLPWIDRYTVRATRGLVHIGVWLFALAMAYPYLPGAHTQAFQGISVVLGLMISLGSSNVIGQAISGLIITYSHTLRLGEYVRIGDVEGTVTELGTFATRVRTGLGEELTLPNSMIVGTVTKNYSRTVKGVGYVVDTVLTIGYDTPWRQIHAMMIEAARRTEGILDTPAPHVFQTALSDFYAEYRVVAQAIASQPRPRAQVLNDLHANLQDVFNENGVQIMSPHYLGDPPQAKIVLPEHWNPPLVKKR